MLRIALYAKTYWRQMDTLRKAKLGVYSVAGSGQK